MPFLIDAHQDLAYNMLSHGRDYRRSAAQTRALEQDGPVPLRTGECLLGWPDYQAGQVALFFGTLYLSPADTAEEWETQRFANAAEASRHHLEQYHAYRHLCEQEPELFRMVLSRADLAAVLDAWRTPAVYPETTHPVGIALLMEGAEGLPDIHDLVEWYERGVRMVGPVWGGGRYCGAGFGDKEPRRFDREGYALLALMAELGMALDVSHMNHESLLQAADAYAGEVVIASHIACESIHGEHRERLLNDEGIVHLIERNAVIGLVPSNRFLSARWNRGNPRDQVTLMDLAAHIDHICQIAGNSRHAAFGTDFDGGFGRGSVPAELDSIADLQKMSTVLMQKGYNEGDIENIFGRNWQRILENVFR
ncbi:MAG: membrane dipeptidase [Anaerolineae bacterium]|nr:membrane dipeptidase [Anaerolineae bacterium]